MKNENCLHQNLDKIDERIPSEHVCQFVRHHKFSFTQCSLATKIFGQINCAAKEAPNEWLAQTANQTQFGAKASADGFCEFQKFAFQFHVRPGAAVSEALLNSPGPEERDEQVGERGCSPCD